MNVYAPTDVCAVASPEKRPGKSMTCAGRISNWCGREDSTPSRETPTESTGLPRALWKRGRRNARLILLGLLALLPNAPAHAHAVSDWLDAAASSPAATPMAVVAVALIVAAVVVSVRRIK